MQPYKNLSGVSGVRYYEIDERYINVHFKDGTAYHYNYIVPGVAPVEEMKSLARKGLGLNTFINQFVKKNYAARLS
ncbi:hypothetical protein WJU16_16630 [Chitinophaga pollutisoli]|uniref:KTSC domain-containing protein n=1 Tax=Chitinophaga pollutisoli TaxID=3133966 RepID=A0ABZ2YIV9_9BACT